MFFEEKWERNLSNEKYIFRKKLEMSYLMDIEIVKTLSKKTFDKEAFISGSFRVI
jgi:hypothetical protein